MLSRGGQIEDVGFNVYTSIPKMYIPYKFITADKPRELSISLQRRGNLYCQYYGQCF